MQERWTHTLDEITHEFRQAFGALSLEQLNWRAHPEAWSIAQNLEHLIKINQTYHPVIAAVKNGTYTLPWLGRFDFMVSFLGRILLKAVQPDRRKKMKTFPIWEPSISNIPQDIWERFEKQQTELKELIVSSSDLLNKGAIISSPANKNLVYRLETAFDIIVAHERRHFEQCKEIDNARQG